MLKHALTQAGRAPRVSRPSEAFPLAVLAAYAADDAAADALRLAADRLGLNIGMAGRMAILQPRMELAAALETEYLRAAGLALPPTALSDTYPQPAQLTLAQRALLREFTRLPAGADAAHLPLLAQGLRLAEGPSSPEERARYQREVRQAAAKALRLDSPGGVLRACAYLIVTGGIYNED